MKNYAGPNQTSDRLNPIEPTKKYRGGPIWPLRSLTSLRARGRVRGGPVSSDKEEKKAVPSRTLCGGPFRRGRDGIDGFASLRPRHFLFGEAEVLVGVRNHK